MVALGEPSHGNHEPLAFRNRLFRFLVEELGFTAIAIESGLPESRRIQDFIAGGSGDAAQIVRENLLWGFGALGENVELVQWMRAYNADPAHRRKVRFYGMDLSLGGPGGATPTPIPFETVLSYLGRADSESASRMRTALRPLLDRLPGGAPSSFSPADHDKLTAAIDDLVSLFERERSTLIAASSPAEYEWAYRNAIVARQSDRMFRLVPPPVPGGGISPAAWEQVNARDAAMAENVRWVLAQEGPMARVLVFAANAHVMNGRVEGGVWSRFKRPPNAMGVFLRSAFGEDMVIIGTSSVASSPGLPQAAPESNSIDAALARTGRIRFLLDLHAARADRSATAWLMEPRPLRSGSTYLTVSPGLAFDALLFIDRLTPARTALPR
jgi:erythromycin esterase